MVGSPVWGCPSEEIMARRNREWTKATKERREKEGRGQGEGKDYIPWFFVEEFPSRGRRHRIAGSVKTGKRIHHLFSNQELYAYHLFEWSDEIIDIREQYPLLDLDLAFDIADDMGIDYPTNHKNKASYVLTTDFMLTLQKGEKEVLVGSTIKCSQDLKNERTIEKLELERRYYLAQGIEWEIITDTKLSRIFSKNVEVFRDDYDLNAQSDADQEIIELVIELLKERLTQPKTTIAKITSQLDREFNLEQGTSMKVFRHLVARKIIVLEMFEKKFTGRMTTEKIYKIL